MKNVNEVKNLSPTPNSVKVQPLKVIDLFCGAGGFSAGFSRVHPQTTCIGYDCDRKSLLSYKANLGAAHRLDLYTALPRTIEMGHVLIGGPPCQRFSKSGKVDVIEGRRGLKAFLKIVVHQKRAGKLQSWCLENVPSSVPHTLYVAFELGFTRLCPFVINSADYGSFQARKRAFVGEVRTQQGWVPLAPPARTHFAKCSQTNMFEGCTTPRHRTLGDALAEVGVLENYRYLTPKCLNKALEAKAKAKSTYRRLHPFERLDKPAATVTASYFTGGEQAPIYALPSPRTPSLEEFACLQGFPANYVFVGGYSTKMKQIGNAVEGHVAEVLARVMLPSTL